FYNRSGGIWREPTSHVRKLFTPALNVGGPVFCLDGILNCGRDGMVNGQRLALNELDLSGGISLEAAGRSLTLPPSLSRGCFGPSIRAWYARDTKLLGWICKLNSGLAVAVLRKIGRASCRER